MQNSGRTVWRHHTMRVTNHSYILSHGDLRVEWAHDRHPLAEYVYDVVYMRHWRDVDLARDIADLQ